MNKIDLLNMPVDELLHAASAVEEFDDDVQLDDELAHHGIKGMKWGVRRTPEQLGHKPARKKAKKYIDSLIKRHKNHLKVEKGAKKIEKDAKKAEAAERKKNARLDKKSIEDMSDEELARYVNRKNAERMALTLERDINSLQPEKVSAGKKLANAVGEKAASAIGEGISNAARSLMANAIDKALGQGAYDPLNKLKKEAEKAGYQEKISKAIQQGYKTEQDKIKAEKDKWDFDEDKAERAAKNAKLRRDEEEAARKANSARSSARAYVYNSAKANLGGQYKTSAGSRLRQDDYDFNTPVSRAASSETKALGQRHVSGYLSAPASSTSSSTLRLGQTYIAGYLPAPKDDD